MLLAATIEIPSAVVFSRQRDLAKTFFASLCGSLFFKGNNLAAQVNSLENFVLRRFSIPAPLAEEEDGREERTKEEEEAES